MVAEALRLREGRLPKAARWPPQKIVNKRTLPQPGLFAVLAKLTLRPIFIGVISNRMIDASQNFEVARISINDCQCQVGNE